MKRDTSILGRFGGSSAIMPQGFELGFQSRMREQQTTTTHMYIAKDLTNATYSTCIPIIFDFCKLLHWVTWRFDFV